MSAPNLIFGSVAEESQDVVVVFVGHGFPKKLQKNSALRDGDRAPALRQGWGREGCRAPPLRRISPSACTLTARPRAPSAPRPRGAPPLERELVFRGLYFPAPFCLPSGKQGIQKASMHMTWQPAKSMGHSRQRFLGAQLPRAKVECFGPPK